MITSLIVGAAAIVGVYYSNDRKISEIEDKVFIIEAAIESANFKGISQDLAVIKTEIARIKDALTKK
jgi:hypothetical protein